MRNLFSLFARSNISNDDFFVLLPNSMEVLSSSMTPYEIVFIIESIGGRSFEFPKKINLNSFLVQMLGLRLSEKLVQLFEGELIAFPKASVLERELKRRMALEMRENGAKIGTIASHLDLTERTINTLLSKSKD